MSKKVISFGDVHFSSINPWNADAGENFIKWFEEKDFGNKDDIEMVFVGDIAERDVNPGNVVDQMWRLFSSASKKAKAVYIVCGNHDKKLYHDIEQHSLKFLTNLDNVYVYEKETEVVTENGYSLLMLPWQAKAAEGITLHDYYNKIAENYKNKTYDILVGHWQIKEKSGPAWTQDGVDISQFNAKSYSIGHIHLRIRPEYIGSVFPNATSEQNDSYPRGYKVYEDGKETFEPLPRFLKYVNLELGAEQPVEEQGCKYAYTITNCNSEGEARERYPNLVIKGIEQPSTKVKVDINECANGDISSISNNLISDLPSAFSTMIQEMKVADPKFTVSRSVWSLINSVISKTSNN